MNSGQKIYNLREENGYSQEELAVILGVTSEVVVQWENGVIPGIEKLIELSNLFDVTIDYLLKNNVNIKNTEQVKVRQVDESTKVNRTQVNLECDEIERVEENNNISEYNEVERVEENNNISEYAEVERVEENNNISEYNEVERVEENNNISEYNEVEKVEENNNISEYAEVEKVEENNNISEYAEIEKATERTNISDGLKVERYLNSKKFQAKQKFNGIMFIFISFIPLIFCYYDLLESIQNDQLRGLMSLAIILLTVVFVLKASTYFKVAKESEQPLELNRYGELFLNYAEKSNYYKMNKILINNNKNTQIKICVSFIIVYVVGNNIIGAFSMGNFMRFIIVSILILLAGYFVGLRKLAKYEKMTYETVFTYIIEKEVHPVQQVKETNIKQGFYSKKGVKPLNDTELDTYINDVLKCGKILGLGIIFFALGSIPFLPYFYSDGVIFNSTALSKTPVFIWVISLICNPIALYLLIKLLYLNDEFEINNNYEFILNEFVENKLKSKYKKFQASKKTKKVLAKIMCVMAVLETRNLVFWFKGTINNFYVTMGITILLYALVTYIIIVITYEQRAYRTLFKNLNKQAS